MTLALWMILVAGVLPWATTGLAKTGGFDNRAPRDWVNTLTGWRQRADWAHRNHFEAFPLFAAAVLTATLTHVPPGRVDALAGSFILFRLAYTVAYIADWVTLRSIVWFGGVACVVGLFVAGA